MKLTGKEIVDGLFRSTASVVAMKQFGERMLLDVVIPTGGGSSVRISGLGYDTSKVELHAGYSIDHVHESGSGVIQSDVSKDALRRRIGELVSTYRNATVGHDIDMAIDFVTSVVEDPATVLHNMVYTAVYQSSLTVEAATTLTNAAVVSETSIHNTNPDVLQYWHLDSIEVATTVSGDEDPSTSVTFVLHTGRSQAKLTLNYTFDRKTRKVIKKA